MPCECKEKVLEGEAPEAQPPEGTPTKAKRPLRGRSAKSRQGLQELAFSLFQGLTQDRALPNTRAKLLAWAAIYAVNVKEGLKNG